MFLKYIKSVWHFFVKVVGYIPFLQCLVAYQRNVHRAALRKFFILLVLTSLPVIVTAFMAPIPDGGGSIFSKLLNKIGDSLTVSELFVYSATFLTPILYLMYERAHDLSPNSILEYKKVFRGYGLVTVTALVVIVLTAVAFGATKFQVSMTSTFLHFFLVEYSAGIYFFGLFCWYLTLLDGANTPNFVDATRDDEKRLSTGFKQRLEQRG